jgi:hypothetical protein
MALDRRFSTHATKPVDDLFSLVPTDYADALGDAEAQLSALLVRLDKATAPHAEKPATPAEVGALRAELADLVRSFAALQDGLPAAQQLHAQLGANKDAGTQSLSEELSELRDAGVALAGLQQAAARAARAQGDDASRELSAGALRRAAERLAIDQSPTRLQAHGGDGEPEPDSAGAPELTLDLRPAQLRAVRHLSHKVRVEVQSDPAQPLSEKVQGQLKTGYGDMLTHLAQAGGPPLQSTDTEALIQRVMYEAYASSTEDLRSFAMRVDFYTELKKAVRRELEQARKHLSDHANGKDLTAPYDKVRFSNLGVVTDGGKLKVRPPQPDGSADNVAQLDDYIKDLESQLSSIGEDSQLAQLRLQNMVQRQQQMLQTLSNLAKVFHETHMSIIRKIGN